MIDTSFADSVTIQETKEFTLAAHDISRLASRRRNGPPRHGVMMVEAERRIDCAAATAAGLMPYRISSGCKLAATRINRRFGL